jgi:hypothetical protein
MLDETLQARAGSDADFADEENLVKCSLCGMVFEPAQEKSCGGCPIKKDCGRICCPNCGFQMPKDSRLVRWLKRKLNK